METKNVPDDIMIAHFMTTGYNLLFDEDNFDQITVNDHNGI